MATNTQAPVVLDTPKALLNLVTRLASLDAIRGLAIAGMILVVSPGSWDYRYAPLLHADWYGWTLADMVFPMFLFAVGLAIILSFRSHFDRGASKRALAF